MQTRNTFQKAMTLEAVRELKSHPTADEVYSFICGKYPEISRATVYRNLNYLCDVGSIYRVKVSDGADHFDHNTIPHYHFVCAQCSCVEDINLPYMDEINAQCQELSGCTITDHQIFFEGFCNSCTKKASKSVSADV